VRPGLEESGVFQSQQSAIERWLEEQRREKSQREASLGPIAAAVGMLRESCATTRLLLDELESSVGVHLGFLDAVLRQRFGNRWWEEVRREAEEGC